VSLTARDADVIKTYVRLGLGVGVVASMAIEPEDEKDLAVVEAGHLFPSHVTWIGFRSGALLRGFTYDFIQLLAPHLTRERIERILSAPTPAAREKLISAIELPRYD
jgi:LysR family cys regulon transcriptional activator